MEQLLLKLARQLDAMDEASLMALWDKYAHTVNQFEPSQRWQEAVLVLSFIQAKRWKNQLFNTQWAARTRAGNRDNAAPGLPPQSAFTLEPLAGNAKESKRRARILPFSPATSDE